MPAGSAGKAGSRVLKGGPSKLRGVIWHKSNGKWEARIYEAGKQRFLGYYTSEVSAAKAYDARAVQLHGSAAKVNFPEDHYETRNNPPAVKSFCALSIPTPTKDDETPYGKTRGMAWSSGATATKRVAKRKGDSTDEDYVLPSQSRSQRLSPQYSLRRSSHRKICQDQLFGDGDSDSEESLEKGAVEVLANLWSSSDQDGSWRSSTGSAVKWNVFGADHPSSRACSPPTASTGASPAPAHPKEVWTPPLFVQRGSAGSSELLSQPTGTLQECLHMKGLHESEDFGESESLCPATQPVNGSESSSDSEQVSENLQFRRSRPFPVRTVERKLQFSPQVALEENSEGMQNPPVALKSSITPQHKGDSQGLTANFQTSFRVNNGQPSNRGPSAAASSPPSWIEERDGSQRREASLHTVASNRVGLPFGNASKPTRGSSRFRGVSWCEKGQKWRALLWDGNRQHFLGHFKSEEEGARAYDKALLLRKKKDGCLNFPLSDYQGIVDGPHPPFAGPQSTATHTPLQPAGDNPYKDNKPQWGNHTGTRISESPQPWDIHQYGQKEVVNTMSRHPGELPQQDSSSRQTLEGYHKRWRAEIRVGSRAFLLGSFEDKQSAITAYNKAMARYCQKDGQQILLANQMGFNPSIATSTEKRSTCDGQIMSKDGSILGNPHSSVNPTGQLASRETIPRTVALPSRNCDSTCADLHAGNAAHVSEDTPAIVPSGWGHKKRRDA